jgi:hypothetical protein
VGFRAFEGFHRGSPLEGSKTTTGLCIDQIEIRNSAN